MKNEKIRKCYEIYEDEIDSLTDAEGKINLKDGLNLIRKRQDKMIKDFNLEKNIENFEEQLEIMKKTVSSENWEFDLKGLIRNIEIWYKDAGYSHSLYSLLENIACMTYSKKKDD